MIDRRAGADVLWFLLWNVVGALYALALVSLMTIGIVVLLVAVPATWLVARHPRSRIGMPGLVGGAALPLFFVAYLNRDGPGTVCTATGTGQRCADEWSPWPWFGVGIALLAGGVALFVRLRTTALGDGTV